MKLDQLEDKTIVERLSTDKKSWRQVRTFYDGARNADAMEWARVQKRLTGRTYRVQQVTTLVIY
jgi:hypothetical protein